MDQNQLAQYINAYRVSPHLFNDDEVDELTKYAKEAGINFNRNMEVEEAKQSGVVSQFIGGVAEGFLGPLNIFGGSTKDPVTSAQQISRSVGSLIGFVPGLLGGPIKAGASVVAKAGGTALAKKMLNVGQALQIESIPIRAANKILGRKKGEGIFANYLGNAGKVTDEFLKGSTVMGNVAQSAVHLGTASAVSEFWKGPDAVKDAFIHGAIAGGAFGTIGNYRQLIEKAIGGPSPMVRQFAESRLREGIAKGLAGSAFQGGMATMHGADTATQIYEYMLGAYFGSVHPSIHQKLGREYFNKYDADKTKKNYKMMEDPEFSALPKDAQAEVKYTFDKYVGDKFDDIASNMKGIDRLDRSTAAQELRNQFAEEQYEAYSTRAKKSREDMTEKDRLEAQKDIVSAHEELGNIIQEGTRIGEEINTIKPERLEGETKRIYDKLTKEQVEQIKEGNYDSIYNEFGKRNEFFNDIESKFTGQDFIRQNEEARIQGELESDPVLRVFFRDVNKQIQAKETNELTSFEIADKVVKANETVKTKLNEQRERQKLEDKTEVQQEFDRYELFKNEVYKELNVKPTDNIDRALVQSYERFRQNKKQYHSSFNLENGKLNKIEEYSNGVRKVLSHPMLPHEKIYKHGNTYVISEILEGNKSYDPLAKVVRFKDNGELSYDFLLTPEKMADLMVQVSKTNKSQYIWTPEKDKGKLIVRNYHPDTKQAKLFDILKTPKEREHFKFDQQEFLKLTGVDKMSKKTQDIWKQMHEDIFKSNYLYDPKSQFKSALDLVKRSSLLSSKDYELNVNKFKDFTPDNKLDVIFVDDVASAKDPRNPIKQETFNVERIKDGKKVIEERMHKSDVDGYIVLHTDLFNKIVKEVGLDPTTSHIKPVIATEIDGNLFLLKGGIHPSQKGYDAVMPTKGSMIVMTSAAKVNPGKTYTAFPNEKNEYKFYKDGKEVVPETTKINFEDLRINFGVYGDKHAVEPVSIKRQMHSTLAGLNISAKGQSALMQIFKDSYLGIEKHNKYVEQMLENPNMKLPKDFDISRIGHKQIADILNSNSKSPVVKELVNDIFKITKERKRSDSTHIDDVDLMESKNYADRIAKEFKDTDYNTLAVRFLEDQSGNFNDAVVRYTTDKYLNPRYDFSASSWVAGNHALFKNRLPDKEIRKDHFMLGHSMKDMKHKQYGTLGKAWEVFEVFKEKATKQEIQDFKDEHLRIAVMRVPSPDISGTRVLYFDGFTGKRNKAYDYGTYLRQKDHFYIDGADVDGDKVFLYQGMPKEYLDGVYKKRNNLERDGVAIENKAKKNDALYDQSTKAELEYINSSISQYMPNALLRSGMSAKAGKDGMGQVVSAKEYLNIILSDVMMKQANKTLKPNKRIKLYNSKGKAYAEIKLGEVTEKTLNRRDGYIDHSLETSSRTADSSGYYNLIDAIQMKDILLQKALPNARVYVYKDGKVQKNKQGVELSRKPIFGDLRGMREYTDIFSVKENLYRSKNQQGERPNLDAIQNNLSAFSELGLKYQSSLVELSNAYGRPENFIETNLIRPETINFKKYNRFVREFQGGFKDPSLLRNIRRQKITIVPDLGKRRTDATDSKRAVKESTYKTNDLMDAASVLIQNKAGERLYNDMIKRGLSEENFIEFADRIAIEAVSSKDDYAKIRSIDPSLRKNKKVVTVEQAEEQIRNRRNDIIETAEELGINPINASRYFDMYMLGSLYPQTRTKKELEIVYKDKLKKAQEAPDILKNGKPNKNKQLTIARLTDQINNFEKYYNKTSRHNYPYLTNEIPNSSKRMFMNTFGQMFDFAVSPKVQLKAEVKQASVDPIMDNVTKKGPETIQQKDQGIKEKFEESMPFRNLFDLKVSDASTKAPADAKADAKRIVEAYKRFPEHSLDNINDMFIAMVENRDRVGYGIEEATYRDLKDFANTLEEIVSYKPKGNKVSWWDKYLFPKRVAEKQFAHDFTVPFKTKVNFRDAQGNLGRTDIRIPMGTMQYLQNSYGSIYNLQNIVTNIAQEERDAFFTWRKDILDLPNGVSEANKLHQAAMTRYLRNQGRNELETDFNWKEWKENEPLYNSLKDKTYKITEKGKQREVTGEELMQTIAKQNEAFLDKVYNGLVKSNLDFSLIDVYSLSGENAQKPDYKAFNRQNAFLKYNEKTGRANLEFLENKYLKPLTENGRHILKQLGKNGFTAELLGRIRYEQQLEQFVKDLPLNRQKAFREKYRQRFKLTNTPEFSGYIDNSTYFKGVGKVEGRYFPRMFHGDTKVSQAKVKAFMENKRIALRENLERKYIYDPTLTKKEREARSKIKIDERFELRKNDFKRIEDTTTQEAQDAMYKKIINEKIAELETMFEAQLGKSLTLDNGSGQEGAEYLWSKYLNKEEAVKGGHFSKPSSGQSRGEEPMPGASYEFKVIEAYQEQWINSFFKNATALIGKKAIDRYVELNPLKDAESTEEWANLMRDYTTDVLGQPTLYNPKTFGLRKSEIAKHEAIIKQYKKQFKKGNVTREYVSENQYNKSVAALEQNKKFQTFDKRLFYYVTDEAGINALDKISTKLWGRKDKPKLPFYGELPKSPEARRQTLSRILHSIGAAEAKWSLITLLSHPKTAVANLFGGSHNTIASAGLYNFTTATFNKKKLLATIFKGTKLNDGTEITTAEHLRRFAEESGAHETFYVTEASLERKFAGKEAKEFLREVQESLKNNPSIGEADVLSIAKKYKITTAVANAAAIPMRFSEKKLRTDSFFAHYLNAYNNLKNFIPNIKHNDPYVINMALKGVEATQFLYHSAFRPNYSRTALGKVMTRFHPFAWNSVRFRRQTYQRASRYGFKQGTQSFEKFKRLATLDLIAMSLANMFTSSVFDATVPPPLNWLQDTADWLFGDERERDRAFFSSWPHPVLAPLQIVTPPIARYPMTLINAGINGNWERFSDYYLWTFFPFGRFGRSIAKTIETPEMWVEQMTGIPIHGIGREKRNLVESD